MGHPRASSFDAPEHTVIALGYDCYPNFKAAPIKRIRIPAEAEIAPIE
jgi:hypothetical protein